MENFTNDKEIALSRLELKSKLSRADKVKQAKNVLTLLQVITIVLSGVSIGLLCNSFLSPLCFIIFVLTIVVYCELASVKGGL